MKFFAFLQNSLSIIWVVLALAAASLVLGWILGKVISKLIVRLLGKTAIPKVVSKWLKQPDTVQVETWVSRLIRWIVFLLAALISARILYSHPDIGSFFRGVWTFIVDTARLEVVVFLFDLGVIALATFLLFKSFRWVKTGFAALSSRVESERGERLKGIKIQKVQLLSAKQLTNLFLTITKYSRYLVDLVLILIYLTGVFSVFPQTRGFVNGLLGSLFQMIALGWKGFVEYLPSLVNLVIIIAVTYYGLKFIHFIFGEISKKTIVFAGFHPDWAEPTFQLVRVAVIALALVVAFPYLPGSASPAFQGITIFIGALFSLGSTSVVGNIVAGIVLTYTRAFQLGDRVQIASTIGDVIDKGLLVTRIRTIKNVEVAIPNSMVLSSHIINYSMQSQERGLILNTTVTIGYDTPWRLMHETLIQAALATADILKEPHPFVLQTSLDDFFVSYELNAYTNQPQKMAVIYSDLHQSIQDKCNEAGIEIMSPHYGALRDGNASTIPADHLPKDYQAPSFQVGLHKD
jgi:small-conductance mechanosensitive channel